MINNTVKNPFQTPAQQQTQGFGAGLASMLKRNTKPFNPATVGTFNTMPKLTTPVQGTIQAPGTKTALGGMVAAPAASAGLQKPPPQPTALAQPQMTTPSGIPVTGNAGTWGGGQQPQATPPVQTGGLTSTGYASPVRGLFPDIVTSLANRSRQPSQAFTQAQSNYDSANKELQRYESEIADQLALEEGRAIPLGFVQGRQQVIRRQGEAGLAARESALTRAATQTQTALQQEQLEQGALTNAANFAPEATRYGAFSGAGGGLDPSTQAQQYAKEVANGTRSYADAVNAMGMYGNAGQQFLDSAIRQASPNFNFAQAQSLADIQGTIGPQYNFATQALQNVEDAFAALGGSQKTNVPLWNQFANFASLQTGIGGEQSRRFVSAVQSLRNAYAAILATARGGTPSDFSAQAIAEIPDIPTPNDLAAIRHNLETLGQARVGIYGQPGGSQTPNTQSGGAVIQTSAGPVTTGW